MKPSLLITLDSMRYENTGLHTFGHHLGREIIRQGTADFDISAYIYPLQDGFLGQGAGYVRHHRYHRFFVPFKRHFDLVHFADQYCRFSPTRVGAKTVMTVHDLNQLYERKPGSKKMARYLERMARRIGGADRVVAISNYVAADIVRHFPEAKDKIEVIYNGTSFSCAPDGHRPRFDPQAPFLFTVGMVCAKKNFHVLVPLLRGNERHLVIAGVVKEDYRQTILAAAQAHGVSERVHILGPVSQYDKDWYFAHCEAFLFPSLAEGFGLPVIEAMHHGCPVFLSKMTALPEVGGDAAWYFDHFEPDHMADVLRAGLAEFARSRGAERGRNRAAQFTWEKAGAAYLALYRDCLGR